MRGGAAGRFDRRVSDGGVSWSPCATAGDRGAADGVSERGCCWRRARRWRLRWREFRRGPAWRTGSGPRDFAVPLVERQLNVRSLEGFGLEGHPAAAIAAGAVLHYVRTTQKNEALHIDSLKFQEHSRRPLELDQVTVRNLELVEPLFQGQDSRATLFHTLDACLTPMGKRLLRATILRLADGCRRD